MIAKSINRLPGEFETSGAVLGAMMNIDMLGRPDNYYETLAPEYRALTPAQLDHAARAALDPKGFTWIVVGDAAKVRRNSRNLECRSKWSRRRSAAALPTQKGTFGKAPLPPGGVCLIASFGFRCGFLA